MTEASGLISRTASSTYTGERRDDDDDDDDVICNDDDDIMY